MKMTKYILLLVSSLTLLIFSRKLLHQPKRALPPADIIHPKPDGWPTFSGDYTGRRYRPLKPSDSDNVKKISRSRGWPTSSGGYAHDLHGRRWHCNHHHR